MNQNTFDEIAPGHLALWQKAASMAARCHNNQWRKDKVTPYSAHPFRVAMILRHIFGVDDEAALAAALLHDVIEDTDTDFDDVEEECGLEVAEIVAALTKNMSLRKPIREKKYDEQLAAASWKAQIAKLADVYDNICDSVSGDMRRRALEKAPRAIACANSDHPQIAVAIQHLEALVRNATE